MERAVDEPAADVSVRRRRAVGALDRQHRDAQLGKHEVIPNARAVDRPAGACVRVEQRVEVGDGFLRVAGGDPREVLHRITEVGELEVEDCRETPVVVQEVARSGVALHQ